MVGSEPAQPPPLLFADRNVAVDSDQVYGARMRQGGRRRESSYRESTYDTGRQAGEPFLRMAPLSFAHPFLGLERTISAFMRGSQNAHRGVASTFGAISQRWRQDVVQTPRRAVARAARGGAHRNCLRSGRAQRERQRLAVGAGCGGSPSAVMFCRNIRFTARVGRPAQPSRERVGAAAPPTLPPARAVAPLPPVEKTCSALRERDGAVDEAGRCRRRRVVDVSATSPAVDVIRGAAVARYSRATPGMNAPNCAGAVPSVSASVVSTVPLPRDRVVDAVDHVRDVLGRDVAGAVDRRDLEHLVAERRRGHGLAVGDGADAGLDARGRRQRSRSRRSTCGALLERPGPRPGRRP